MKFIKNVKKESGDGFEHTSSLYIPVEPCNFLSITHNLTIVSKKKEGEELVDIDPVTREYMAMEMPFLSEYPESVPLKASRKVKQTKTEEFFFHEEPVKIMRPTLYKIETEEIPAILHWVKQNLINP